MKFLFDHYRDLLIDNYHDAKINLSIFYLSLKIKDSLKILKV
jgi:hypothetical protein